MDRILTTILRRVLSRLASGAARNAPRDPSRRPGPDARGAANARQAMRAIRRMSRF